MISRGIFAVYKPAGVTSAAVTNRIKRILLQQSDHKGKLKVGHGGTLDRQAEGVLVIGIGEDCKKLQQFLHGEKSYESVGELGKATDTLDNDNSSIVEEKAYDHIMRDDLERVVESFRGEMIQTPPVYSALKLDGRRLSDWAREGIIIPPKPRHISIHSISLVEFYPPHFKIRVCCSAGTYIRSLIHEVGLELGTVAHTVHLCRTGQGPFTLKNALQESQWNVKDIQGAIQTTTVV